jgi:hypothetical protein
MKKEIKIARQNARKSEKSDQKRFPLPVSFYKALTQFSENHYVLTPTCANTYSSGRTKNGKKQIML